MHSCAGCALHNSKSPAHPDARVRFIPDFLRHQREKSPLATYLYRKQDALSLFSALFLGLGTWDS